MKLYWHIGFDWAFMILTQSEWMLLQSGTYEWKLNKPVHFLRTQEQKDHFTRCCELYRGSPLTRKSLTRFLLPQFLAYVRASGGFSVIRGPQCSSTNMNFKYITRFFPSPKMCVRRGPSVNNMQWKKHKLPAYFWHKLKLNNPTTKQIMAIKAMIPFDRPAIDVIQDFLCKVEGETIFCICTQSRSKKN